MGLVKPLASLRMETWMTEKRINSQEAVARAIEWLELDTPPSADVMESLSTRFLIAACNPSSTYIVIASKRSVVQVFGGKAVCVAIPEGTNINEELEAKFGGRFLDAANIFATCMVGLEGRRREKLQAMADASFAETEPARRMVFGA
jgi:hypothetical protein